MNVFSGFANVNGTNLQYEVSGEGQPLVLLHSGYTDMRIWDFQTKELAKYYKVIRYDIRGYGKSKAPISPFYHYEDLYELLKFLNIEKAYLLGVSMGGSIAIDFTLQYPEMVDGLILSGPSVSGYKVESGGKEDKKRHKAGLSIIKKDRKFKKSIDYLLNDPMWKQENKIVQGFLHDIFSECNLAWMLKNYVQYLDPSAASRLSEIDVSTLIILGENDSDPILEISKFLVENIKDLKINTIKNTGHLPNLDKPTIFNRIVIDFMKNIANEDHVYETISN